ncbi:molybdenum cofactor guanylyltransferase [Frigoriflavimonas asaccharolytica]|uniref:Probable molybdenum cofactor guanylyltransferase n=1 Tax=Frigoriflavimonas asaccharolytica TaxID=2735899 RepID=A0A8J8G4B1_9FLAO|nr:molybdenum cofactor guanylyltransferase [Frigoriflavimonas asaccharolytica]NRS91213.1 molybdopterin-guanine dinucleotide biosynthesis protein A [Frigoriflavimonas asaccharolytica]
MKHISAYILAGGKSSRMGSDKGLLPLNETTFIEHIVKALQGSSIKNITIVSSNKDYDFLNCNRIEDIYPDKGPVGGIFTALSHSKTEQNLILSVDIPLISVEIINWLIENIDEEKQITQVKILDKTSPLVAVYNKNTASIFEENLIKNQLKLMKIVENIPNKTIEVPENWCKFLQNINTKEDYQNLIK